MYPRLIHNQVSSRSSPVALKAAVVLIVLLLALTFSIAARAGTAETAASILADKAFDLLASLNKQSTGAGSNPLLGPIASFAGDADSLSKSLSQDDSGGASSALQSLQSDQAAVDQALKGHPEAVSSADWSNLKEQLATLEKEVPPSLSKSPAKSITTSHVSSAEAEAAVPPPVVPSPASAAPTAPVASTDNQSAAPQIVITSREMNGDTVRLRGYFEGYALKSAGIYQGESQVRSFKVSDVPGEQRLEFDLRLGGASADTALRVADAEGRSAQASAIESAGVASIEPETGDSAPAMPPNLETDTGARSSANDGSNGAASVAEIPSHGPFTPSPSKRHTLGSRLGDVRIDVAQVVELGTTPPTYQVTGQIHGPGVTHAGVFVDGRLVQQIAISTGTHLTSFSERFIAEEGSVTIRAYGVGDQFTETPVDINDTSENAAVASAVPPAIAPSSGPAILITAITPIANNLYTVSGVISGPSIASAGLYQNGTLAQPISVNGGIVAMLGALLPRNYRRLNFSTRFNPYAGPATIRAFDSTGDYNEQPIIIAGVTPGNPAFAVNPYSATNPGFAGTTVPYSGPGSSRPMLSTRPLW